MAELHTSHCCEHSHDGRGHACSCGGHDRGGHGCETTGDVGRSHHASTAAEAATAFFGAEGSPERDEMNARLEASFAKWLATTPFGPELSRELGLSPVPLERLQELYALELRRLSEGRYASFDEVYGPLLHEAGLDALRHRGTLERLERDFLARGFVFLERGTRRAWERILKGDVEGGVPAILSAARSGHGLALLYASRLFRHGIGVGKDEARAMEALEGAADTDCGQACLELAATLREGTLGATDAPGARRALEKAVRLAVPETWADLGRALCDGWLGDERRPEGETFLRRAVRRGSAQAAYDLGALIAAGEAEPTGTTPFELLQLAAQGGYAAAMHDLAFLFLRLARTDEDGCDLSARECFAMAAHWFARAAQAGDAECADALRMNLSATLSDGSVARLADFVRKDEAGNARPAGSIRHGRACGHTDDDDDDGDEDV